uniref:Serine aminopeptidase S33 domain-containing protein n=1 Tax=uncultured prokaryote TaxID=198431 RepID=A0A0H5PVN6_9ZZZZ|nr:hypothetical protein [uncultured prokaryote]
MSDIHTFTLPASADGLTLSVLQVVPSGVPPRGILQLVHGMCEHKERYLPFMQFMADNGYACVLHDHRGHGASAAHPGDLGYFSAGGWRAMVDDVLAVHRHACDTFPGLPCHLFGHSMGSLVVRALLKRHSVRLASVTVCGSPSLHPATGLAQGFSALCERMLGGHYRPMWLQALSFGGFDRPYRHEHRRNAWICSDSAVVEAYNADPLCNFVFTANGFRNLFALMRYCYSPKDWGHADANLPVHFVSGGDDVCRRTDKAFHSAADLMRRVGYRRTDSHLFGGMRHEILNEPQRLQVWRHILASLKEDSPA